MVLCVLAGAVINALIAAACSIGPIEAWSGNERSRPVTVEERQTVGAAGESVLFDEVLLDAGFGIDVATIRLRDSEHQRFFEWLADFDGHVSFALSRVELVATRTGLPLRSFRGAVWFHSSDWAAARNLQPDAPATVETAGAIAWPGPGQDGPITPWHPIWTGLLLNTLFYAGVSWIVYHRVIRPARTALLRAHARRHVQRGVCPRCRYPLPPSGRCPECGHDAATSPT